MATNVPKYSFNRVVIVIMVGSKIFIKMLFEIAQPIKFLFHLDASVGNIRGKSFHLFLVDMFHIERILQSVSPFFFEACHDVFHLDEPVKRRFNVRIVIRPQYFFFLVFSHTCCFNIYS